MPGKGNSMNKNPVANAGVHLQHKTRANTLGLHRTAGVAVGLRQHLGIAEAGSLVVVRARRRTLGGTGGWQWQSRHKWVQSPRGMQSSVC